MEERERKNLTSSVLDTVVVFFTEFISISSHQKDKLGARYLSKF